jgi:ferredoxin
MIYQIENKIYDLPIKKLPNFSLLALCNNCNDCIKACPVSAIHFNETYSWIDARECELFSNFGNDPKIPSIKWNWIKLNNFNLSDQEIENIHNFIDCKNSCGCIPNGIVTINNLNYVTTLPICRECTSQKRCTKYKGCYSYDWDNIKLTLKQ